jgi:hypothetical protein
VHYLEIIQSPNEEFKQVCCSIEAISHRFLIRQLLP